MHTEKQKIFDEYAVLLGFDDWQNLLHKCPVNELPYHTFNVCDLVQQEQQKRIATKAVTVDIYGASQKVILKDSIINPENLIK